MPMFHQKWKQLPARPCWPGHHTLFIRERHLENDNANAKNVSGYLEKCGVGNPKTLH
jgi:hypothetical protein